jgi:hypothetical protein
VLRTIVRCLLPREPSLDSDTRRAATDQAIEFVSAAIAGAPFHIRLGERVLRILIWLWLLPAARAESVETGAGPGVERSVEAFARLAPPFASIVRLYRSLALLAFLESDAVVQRLGYISARDRQDRFRALRVGAIERTP